MATLLPESRRGRFGFLLLCLGFLLLIPRAYAQAARKSDCLSCHDQGEKLKKSAHSDLTCDTCHELKPGVLYALNAHDRHIVRPRTDIVTACVFNPPVTGREVHDETGAYPADAALEPAD